MLKKINQLILYFVLITLSLVAEDTPLKQKIEEQKLTKIICSWNEGLPKGDQKGLEGKAKKVDAGTYSYFVWLPKYYHSKSNKKRKYPFLVVDHSGGNSQNKFPIFKDWIDSNRWICIMMVEAKNRQWDRSVGNYLSMMKDVKQRFRLAPESGVFCGASGGARRATWFASFYPKDVGAVLHSAATMNYTEGLYLPFSRFKHMFSASVLADRDSNVNELQVAYREMKKRGYFDIYEGKHGWFPKDRAAKALSWLTMKMSSKKKNKLPDKSVADHMIFLYKQYRNAEELVLKNDFLTDLKTIMRTRSSAVNSKKKLRKIKQTLHLKFSKLKGKPEFKKELAAWKAYQKTYQRHLYEYMEAAHRGGTFFKKKWIPKFIKETAEARENGLKQFKIIIEKHPETYAAKMAQKEISRLEVQEEKISNSQ